MEKFLQAIEVVCPIKPAVAKSEKNDNMGLRALRAGTPTATGNRISHSVQQRNTSSSVAGTSNSRPPKSTAPSDVPATTTFTLPALFPNITASLRPPPPLSPERTIRKSSISNDYSAIKLARLTSEEEFDQMLGEILMEEGFTELVERVQERLKHNVNSG